MLKSVGEQELELLSFLAERPPMSVKEVADVFGAERKLARTTILTMMERLRKKGYLKRQKKTGKFYYSTVVEQPALLRGLVGNFVKNTLGGSVSPFAAYLADSKHITAEEIGHLRAVLDNLEKEAKD
jgi:predicted transcriptional regulator